MSRYDGIRLVALSLFLGFGLVGALAAEDAKVTGSFTFNGEEVKLPYVYVVEDEGFYEDTDPTWKIMFVEKEVEERELGSHIWDSALLELGVTLSAEFDDEPRLQVYSQNIVPSADYGGNMSGGTYPEIEVKVFGPDRFEARVYQKEEQEFFDDKYNYDLTFSAPLSNPNAPIGEPLPADGGEPGKAYLVWTQAIHKGDLEKLKTLVPADMAADVESEDFKEALEFMQLMTPTDVKILGGSSDGEMALIQVEGKMDGEDVKGEVTVEKKDGFWVPTKSSW